MISLPVKHAEGESCFLRLLFRGRNSHWWNFIFSLYCCCYFSSPLATLAHIFSKPWAAWKEKQDHQERAGLLWLSLLCLAVSPPSCALHKHRVPHTGRDSSRHARCDPQRSRCVAVACPIPRPAGVRAVCLLLIAPHRLGQAHSKGLGVRARTLGKRSITLQEEQIDQSGEAMLKAAE